jgi:hypothetical protein
MGAAASYDMADEAARYKLVGRIEAIISSEHGGWVRQEYQSAKKADRN